MPEHDDQTRGQAREQGMPREAYHTAAYFSLPQLWSFSEQIYHIRELNPSSIIEVGIGNGFVSQFLKSMNLRVLTTDINPALEPDLAIPVGHLDRHVTPGAYDLIACCEVLEHLPFDHFEATIAMFARLSENLFLTLPCAGRIIGVGGLFIKSWGRRWFSFWRHIPSRRYPLPSMHFWEVGWNRETRVKELLAILRRHYRHVDSACFRLNPYHRYFTCTGSMHAGNASGPKSGDRPA